MRTVWDIIKSPVITEKALVAKEESQDTRQLLTFSRKGLIQEAIVDLNDIVTIRTR